MSANQQQAILLGYSGHGYVVAEAANLQEISLMGYAEAKELGQDPYDLLYLGDETQTRFNWKACHYYILGVGSNTIRAKIALRVKEKGGRCLVVIHPDASLAKKVEIGDGTFIARNVAVNPLVQIGENVILNTSCSIDHECEIGDNVHIAPGAVLAGNVKVGDSAFIGANSVIKEGISIGMNAVIGAGSVVLRDIEAGNIVFGNPASLKENPSKCKK